MPDPFRQIREPRACSNPSTTPFRRCRAPPSRRMFLQSAGWVGAGAAAEVPRCAERASAAGAADLDRRGKPDTEHPRFTLAVIPDTQYLFDADRGDSAPLTATLRWILEHQADENIVFTAHLGDIVENARPRNSPPRARSSRSSTSGVTPYSVLAGNHDIDSSTTDQRGPSPYLDVFGPKRFRPLPTYRRCDAGRLQHLPRVPRGGPGVAGVRAGLAAVRRHARLGEVGAEGAPAYAGHPDHPRPRVRRRGRRGRAVRPRSAALGRADQRRATRSSSPSTATTGRRRGPCCATRPAATCTCTSPTTRTATTAAAR